MTKAPWYRKVACFFGWHLWRYVVSPVNCVIVLPNRIPYEAMCAYCGITHGVKKSND
jgi:hypothetical protein